MFKWHSEILCKWKISGQFDRCGSCTNRSFVGIEATLNMHVTIETLNPLIRECFINGREYSKYCLNYIFMEKITGCLILSNERRVFLSNIGKLYLENRRIYNMKKD